MHFESNLIANTILVKSFRDGIPVNPMKLQRILYLVAVEYASTIGQPMLNEKFQPWQHGPVASNVFEMFKSFGAGPVTKYAKNALGESLAIDDAKHEVLRGIIEPVWSLAKRHGAAELSRAIVHPGGAWDQAHRNGREFIRHRAMVTDRSLTAMAAASH